MTSQNLQEQRPKPPFPEQQQQEPGLESQMNPKPDYGENSYQGSGKLQGKAAIITGGDSGIGRAVALAFAREGADVLIAYLNEESDAQETVRIVEKEGRKCVAIAGDIQQEAHCQQIVEQARNEFGKIDILVNNAAFQMTRESLDEISSEEFDRTFKTNIYAMFYLCKAAVPHMQPGSAIINTASINASEPKPKLLAYSATKAAIVNFTGGLAQLVADKGIRVNSVAPGPVWTPLIPATMPNEQVTQFGQQYPIKRPAQPAELAPIYVLLASDEASYVSGAVIPVTGGQPVLP
ncbi:short-chain dehydrogenase/reductase SDR [Scytonema sp. HK-05]|uniref:SDR family oxidoreductase n=1 Tax=Scytonema sp. HK-05 TaxID=1137095 RepID=UPI0009367D3A|nr:SDR family oxidoreductase [Scytonema sp. HK-05]OKH58710.1 NAD(P)-dependent oxidoreductase [Scytonema sp. HK-05]BAY43373.1 short-chain dehydrogenase/reductase SDR [Scytonema sp. HK-05]